MYLPIMAQPIEDEQHFWMSSMPQHPWAHLRIAAMSAAMD